jgi:hypothetical protein
MNPAEYEGLVADTYRAEGWEVRLTPMSNDYGVDVFADRGDQRLAIQVKMYGGGRKVNRAMVMQLYGAAAYFECTSAVLATDGELLPDAMEVADKIGVVVRAVRATPPQTARPASPTSPNFDSVWQRYITPLEGLTLRRPDGSTNVVLKVDWTGIRRRTSNGREQFIEIEVFRQVVSRLLEGGTLSRADINDQYAGRASSGIFLILAQVPLFEALDHPLSLRLRSPA